MTYKRASLIRDLVYNLDQSWDTSNYVAAIHAEDSIHNEFSVYLYSREGHTHQLINLAGFALGLCGLASDINYRMSEYNKATYGEEMVNAIQIW